MLERQLDFFSDSDMRVERGPPPGVRPAPVLSDIADEALIAAIAESSHADSGSLAAESGRRRLGAAVPALAALCRRFAGFGTRRPVPEQAAAIEALAMIGGRDAAHALSQIIERVVVQEPTLPIAVSAAAMLGSALSPDVLRCLLQHPEPGIRADACRCARPLPDLISILIELLDDLDRRVVVSAACALGRMGRTDARPILKGALRGDPSEEVIDALSSIADEECAVLLGRIARSRPTLADAALISLENIDHSRAATIAAAIRRLRRPLQSSASPHAEDDAAPHSAPL